MGHKKGKVKTFLFFVTLKIFQISEIWKIYRWISFPTSPPNSAAERLVGNDVRAILRIVWETEFHNAAFPNRVWECEESTQKILASITAAENDPKHWEKISKQGMNGVASRYNWKLYSE